MGVDSKLEYNFYVVVKLTLKERIKILLKGNFYEAWRGIKYAKVDSESKTLYFED